MSVVANVAINVDSRDASAKLRQFQQQSSAAGKAAQELQKTTNAAGAAATKAGREYQTAANGMRFFIDATGRARKENGQFVTTAEAAAAGLQKQGKAASAASAAMGKLGGIIASLGAGLAARKSFLDASALESANSRIQTLTKNYAQLEGIQGVAADAAVKFRLSQTEALTALTDLGNRLGSQGASLVDIKNIYEGFNTLLANNKVEAAQAASATLQLNQALGSGRLAGEEFNAINEATPQLLDEIARVMGVARGELKDLAADGKISGAVLVEALTNIKENGAEDLETAFSGAFGATRELQAALTDFSAAIGTELLPAITPLIRATTELLKLFGSLPGPVKTAIAAVFGLTAALVALAPAISAASSLLAGLSVATLAAVGPWLALAAGIGVAIAALASYQSEAQKVAGAAKTGTVADVVAARNLSVQKGQEISLLERQRQGASGQKRGSIDRRLRVLRGEQAGLQSAIQGNSAERASTAPVVPSTFGIGAVGGADSKGGGKGKKDNSAEKAAREAQREAELTARQLKAAQDRLFAAEQLVARQQELNRVGEIELERNQTIARIQREYSELISKVKSVEEESALEKARSLEIKTAELEADKAIKELRESALSSIQEENALLEAKLAGKEKEYLLQKQINDLVKGGGGAVSQGQAAALVQANEQMKKQVEAQDKAKASAEALAGSISSALTDSLRGLVDGSMTAQEALSSAFKGIGDAFVDMAMQMIQQWLTMQIMGIVGSLFGAAAGPSSLVQGVDVPVAQMPAGMAFRAAGGPVTNGAPYVVGERGPELFVPGTGGTVVNNNDLRSAMGTAPGARNGPMLNMTFQTTNIGGTEYVSRDQLEAAMAATRKAAANDGARQGTAATLSKLQQSPSTRAKLGLR